MVNGARQDKAHGVDADGDAAPGAGMGKTHGAGMDQATHGSRRTSRLRSSRDWRYDTPLTERAHAAHAAHGTRRIADAVVGTTSTSTVLMRAAAVDTALHGDAVAAVGAAAITTMDPIRVARRLAPSHCLTGEVTQGELLPHE